MGKRITASPLDKRFTDEGKDRDPDRDDKRNEYQRDRDRVLYSPAFRRLAGVTQITAATEQHLLHNRLTHSLKVAQLGRRMAERLLEIYPAAEALSINPDVVETAGLAHDIGHPPFGHATEKVLDPLLEDSCGGFEGNAQSLRIVARLAPQAAGGQPESTGLNLTRASLLGILKYPQFRGQQLNPSPQWTDRSYGDKWGAYATEADELAWIRQNTEPFARAANAVLMDWADDISYATHDVEDFVDAGLIIPERVTAEFDQIFQYVKDKLAKKKGFKNHEFQRACGQIRLDWTRADLGGYLGSIADRSKLRMLAYDWLRQLVKGSSISPSENKIVIAAIPQYKAEILKGLVRFYVIEDANVNTIEKGRAKLIEDLFEMLTNWLADNPKSRRIPLALKEHYEICSREGDTLGAAKYSHDHLVARSTSDYLCDLTEVQIFDIFGRMTGQADLSALGGWLR